jgi:hypothetical protein
MTARAPTSGETEITKNDRSVFNDSDACRRWSMSEISQHRSAHFELSTL